MESATAEPVGRTRADKPSPGTTAEKSSGRPPVVFLHGLFESPAIWETARRRLRAEGHTTFAPPLPGHRSDAVSRPESAGMHAGAAPAAHMADVLRLISGGGPVRLVGHSLGGLIALMAARDHPDLVQDALVVGAPHGGDCGRPASLAVRLFTEVPLIGAVSARMLHQRWLGDGARFEQWIMPSLAPGEFLSGLPARMRDELADGCPETMRDMAIWIRGQSALESFASLSVPVTVVISGRDPIVPPGHQLALARRLPCAVAQVIDSGHLPMATTPDLFARTVAAWAATGGTSLACESPPTAAAPALAAEAP